MNPRSLIRGALLAAVPMLLDVSSALAAGTSSATTASGENTPLHLTGISSSHSSGSTGGSLVRTIVGLFVVIAVIYGIAWVLRQVKGGRTRSSGSGLSSVASLPLGSNRSLSLVRVGRDLVLLGVAEGSVTAIRSYTEEEAIELGVEQADWEEPDDPSEGSAGGLVETLRRLTVRS